MLLVLISLAILIFNIYSPYGSSVRDSLDQVLYQFNVVANSPVQMYEFLIENLQSRSNLIKENKSLQLEMMVMQAKMHELTNAGKENKVLKELLSSSGAINSDFAVAEVIAQHVDSAKKYIVIDKGSDDGVYIGQPIIDAYGLVGQVVEVNAMQARVILISDSRHAIPVQVNRNGVRAIAEGAGQIDTLLLPNVVATTDIKAGDLLVSSGLGQRFPAGYPVGVVESVVQDPGKPFLKVLARPSAKLDRSRYVLLVFTGELPQ